MFYGADAVAPRRDTGLEVRTCGGRKKYVALTKISFRDAIIEAVVVELVDKAMCEGFSNSRLPSQLPEEAKVHILEMWTGNRRLYKNLNRPERMTLRM